MYMSLVTVLPVVSTVSASVVPVTGIAGGCLGGYTGWVIPGTQPGPALLEESADPAERAP